MAESADTSDASGVSGEGDDAVVGGSEVAVSSDGIEGVEGAEYSACYWS